MSRTSIEWTNETWNPTVGCDRVSPGCANCYAKTLHDKRHTAKLDGAQLPAQYLKPFEELQLMADRLDMPLRRKKPTTYFVNSVSDLFHEDVPDAFIDKVFAVMALAPQHTFQVLTKRAERMRDYMVMLDRSIRLPDTTHPRWKSEAEQILGDRKDFKTVVTSAWPLPNVWQGVSVENQHFADERIPLLLDTPATVRFISAEPLLGDVSLYAFLDTPERNKCLGILGGHKGVPGLDWVIVGGESGAGARLFDVEWARSIVSQCQAAGVPVFVKQIGQRPIVKPGRLRHWEWGGVIGREARFEPVDPMHESTGPWRVVLKDRKGGDPDEWPDDLRVRQMPMGAPQP